MKRSQREAIDELAEVRSQLKVLNKREEDLKKILKPLGTGFFKGSKNMAVIEESSRSGFDSDALKAAIPETVWGPYWKPTHFLKISVKPLKTEKISEAA